MTSKRRDIEPRKLGSTIEKPEKPEKVAADDPVKTGKRRAAARRNKARFMLRKNVESFKTKIWPVWRGIINTALPVNLNGADMSNLEIKNKFRKMAKADGWIAVVYGAAGTALLIGGIAGGSTAAIAGAVAAGAVAAAETYKSKSEAE